MAQTPELDRQREYWRQQEAQRQEQQRWAQEEMQRQQKAADDERRNRQEQYDAERKRQDEQWQKDAPKRQAEAEQSAKQAAEMKALRNELLRLPPLPEERNPLLGRWRLEAGGQPGGVAGPVQRGSSGGGLGELVGMLARMDPGKMFCEMSFGGGISFAPSSYSSGGAAGIAGGPITYRSRHQQVIVAIPGDQRTNPMPFEITGPNRIVYADACALVRVDAGHAATPAQMANAVPAPIRSAPSRPSPEVCRNTLLDKLGTVGVNQVRAMSDLRFQDPAIDGKVPNTNNLRIDLRGSACDDPRIKATLYDFDANGMLQSITFVWDRPPGPAPAPIFQERVKTLSMHHAGLPPPQSPGRLQANTSLGGLILQDMPERNLLLEAYAARK